MSLKLQKEKAREMSFWIPTRCAVEAGMQWQEMTVSG